MSEDPSWVEPEAPTILAPVKPFTNDIIEIFAAIDSYEPYFDIPWTMKRDNYTNTIGWFIITPELIYRLVSIIKDEKCLEIGCGLGVLSYILKQQGCDIIKTNIYSSKYDVRPLFRYCLEDIINIEAVDAVKRYNPEINILIICWPCYDDPFAYEAVKEFKGNKVIYIGEDKNGCCANDDFFDYLEKHFIGEYDYEIVKTWKSIYDYLAIYTRRPPQNSLGSA